MLLRVVWGCRVGGVEGVETPGQMANVRSLFSFCLFFLLMQACFFFWSRQQQRT